MGRSVIGDGGTVSYRLPIGLTGRGRSGLDAAHGAVADANSRRHESKVSKVRRLLAGRDRAAALESAGAVTACCGAAAGWWFRLGALVFHVGP